VRGFAYRNQDIALIKKTQLAGGTSLQIRVEAFNMWNWHNFSAPGSANNGIKAFNTDLASAGFGTWNGTVTDSRSVQLAVRFEF
jgi:hypothetical protein